MDTKTKILIVDDKPENLIALEVVLKDLNVELIKATSGNEALKATLYHDFALAILDVQMPEMDGYELARILREEEKTANLPFIFISAVYTANHDVFKGYEEGAFSFITKPFQPKILINKVKFFVEKHQQELELVRLNNNLEKKNAALEYINGELDSFSYSVSHDLRAPLRAIDGYSKMVMEDYAEKLDEKGKKMLRVLMDNSTKMGQLIDDLLEFSRLGKQDVKKVNIDMNLMVSGIISELSAHHSKKETEISVKPLINTMGDSSMIRQVFTNLLSNALKYTGKKERPVIEVGCYKEDEQVVYYVSDNGAGFDMRYYDKLFGVFQRLHSAREFEGTGIGLSLVKRIVSKHEGKIWATGEPDKGANFYFSLPYITFNK